MYRTVVPAGRKWISHAALGIALTMGIVGSATFAPAPAFAAKKKDKAPKMQFSKGFVAVAGPAQTAIDKLVAEDAAAVGEAKTLLDQAFAAIEVEDDRFLAGTLAVNLGSKLRDSALQRRGIKAMLASGKSDPAMAPRFNSIAGQLAYQAGDYAEAQSYLGKAIELGFTENNTEAILAEAYIAENKLSQGLATLVGAIERAKASGSEAPQVWHRRGLFTAYKAGMVKETADFAVLLVRDHPVKENWGAGATILREIGNFSSQETLDLMRLMGRTNSYAEERDFVEYIQAADPRRLPGEVLEVLNAGIASGMLSANDTFVSDSKKQAEGRMAGDKASLPSYAADARKPGASLATVTGAADALLSYGESADAEKLYSLALGKPGVDNDQVLTRLGIAQVGQGKFAEAQATFGKVTGKRQPIARLWAQYAASKAAPATQPVAEAATAAE